jgi:hypothetical protein
MGHSTIHFLAFELPPYHAVLEDKRGEVFVSDWLKEIFSAADSRIRSPIIGSIILFFFIFNWRPIFYLLFSEQSASIRLRFFEMNTNWQSLYFLPGVVGVLAAVFAPWIKLLGAFLVANPVRRLRNMQQDEDLKRRIYVMMQSAEEEDAKSRLEEAKERRKIEAAKRLEEASRISDPTARKELQEDILETRDRVSDDFKYIDKNGNSRNTSDLTETDWEILSRTAKEPKGTMKLTDRDTGFGIQFGFGHVVELKDRQEYLRLLESSEKMVSHGLLLDTGGGINALTNLGYSIVKPQNNLSDETPP